ncbi:MAG: 50S ribosomal protein L1 [FCB group bacterium]|nr:50S ribosomal protein L1 [FCB group bacterium]
MKRSKRYNNLSAKSEKNKEYELDEAVELVKKQATAKFDETIEASIRLGVDPRKADQMIRGSVSLPHGTGKKVRVLVLCKPAKEEEAQQAGADMVGLEDYVEKIKAGWAEMDVVVATPDVMAIIGKLGRILGPRGLMPNPKVGTVTFDVGPAVKELKAGRVSFRVDKTGIIHLGIGKASFETAQLKENFISLLHILMKMKPSTAKGQYLRGVALSSTMGSGIKLDRLNVINALK